jgi:REP-associated tyrosine transposase
MAQTLVNVMVHVVFSTKERRNLILPDLEPHLHAYLGGILRELHSPGLAINGTENHVHLLVAQSKTIALADLIRELKKGSSKWIKTQRAALRSFDWQDGYAAFSIGPSGVEATKRYIAGQKEHHRRRTFQEELVAFLKKYEVDYDERYIWS